MEGIEEEKTPRIPLETFLTVGIALLSVSFGKCIQPWDMGKVPLIALVTGASLFLVQEAFTKDDYKNKSEKLVKVEKGADQEAQVTAFEKARDQALLASEASEKKARNAGTLKTILTMSAGMFVAFPMIHCARNAGFGSLYLRCITKYNSTGNECRLDKQCKNEDGDDLIPCPPTSAYFPPEWSVLPKAYAQENKETKKQNRSFKKQRLGLAAAAGVIGYTKNIGDRMRRVPDIFKGMMFMGLAAVASKSKGQWEKGSESFKRNAKRYDDMAKAMKKKLGSDAGVETCKDDPESEACKDRCKENPGDSSCRNNDRIGGDTRFGVGIGNKVDSDSLGVGSSDMAGVKSGHASSCVVGSVGSMSVDRNCQCRKTNTCSKTNFPKANFSSLGGLPSSVEKAYDSLGRGGDDLYSGNTEGADGHFDDFNNYSAAIDQTNRGIFDKLKDRMNTFGGDDYYDNFEDRAEKYLDKAVLSSYGNMSPNQMGALGDSMGFGDGSSGSFGESFEEGQFSEVSEPDAIFPENSSVGVGGGVMEDLSMGEHFGPEAFGDEDSLDEGDFDEYENHEGDIVDDSSVSLWRVVSTRYMKTALPIFLKKKRRR